MQDILVGFLIGSVIVCLAFGALCSWLAEQKGRDGLNWFILGFCFNMIALLVLGFAPTLSGTKEAKQHSTTQGKGTRPASVTFLLVALLGSVVGVLNGARDTLALNETIPEPYVTAWYFILGPHTGGPLAAIIFRRSGAALLAGIISTSVSTAFFDFSLLWSYPIFLIATIAGLIACELVLLISGYSRVSYFAILMACSAVVASAEIASLIAFLQYDYDLTPERILDRTLQIVVASTFVWLVSRALAQREKRH
jgi:MFS family permease